MRRFMRRLLMLTCGVTGLAFALAIVLRHVEPPAQAQQPIFEAGPYIGDGESGEDALFDLATDAPFDDDGSLGIRQQYVELLRRKAELMSEERIAEAISQLKTEISHREAAQKLETITDELHTLVESHPQTRAAERAKRMLAVPDLLFQGPEGSKPSTDLVPTY